MDAEEKRKQLEQDILTIIEEKLQNGEMDAERAREIAKMLLEKLHPPLTLEQLYAVAPTLDDQFPELSQAILPLLKDHDDTTRKFVTGHAEKLLQEGKIDESHSLLKNATSSN